MCDQVYKFRILYTVPEGIHYCFFIEVIILRYEP